LIFAYRLFGSSVDGRGRGHRQFASHRRALTTGERIRARSRVGVAVRLLPQETGTKMEPFKLSQVVEENILELFAWIYLFPITLANLLFQPFSFLQTMALEREKELGQRYETRMPPVLFFLFGTVPLSFAIVRKGTAEEMATVPTISDASLILGVILSIPPFAWAVSTLVCSGTGYGRARFREEFGTQCYLFCPIWFLVLGFLEACVEPNAEISDKSARIFLFLLVCIVVWWTIIEWRILGSKQIAVSKRIACFVLAVFISTGLMAAAYVAARATNQKWLL
jgi:hypothetical protein